MGGRCQDVISVYITMIGIVIHVRICKCFMDME